MNKSKKELVSAFQMYSSSACKTFLHTFCGFCDLNPLSKHQKLQKSQSYSGGLDNQSLQKLNTKIKEVIK